MNLPKHTMDTITEGTSGKGEEFLIYLQLQKTPE